MTVRLVNEGNIELSGQSQSGEAEELLQFLIKYPSATVDWRACSWAHSAVIQVLLASRRRLIGPPAGEFLKLYVEETLR